MTSWKLSFVGAALLTASTAIQLPAATVQFNLNGPGVSGMLQLTYGPARDATYSNAYEVTGISGTFSDTNSGLNIVNAAVGPLESVRHDSPESTNLLAPHDFSRFAVAKGLGPDNNGFLTYDNLYWPNGSPQTASDYPFAGGIIDIYGLMFEIGGGRVVDLWSNGALIGTSAPVDYGIAVATAATSLDYVGGQVSVSPEPGAFGLLASGLLVLAALCRYKQRRTL